MAATFPGTKTLEALVVEWFDGKGDKAWGLLSSKSAPVRALAEAAAKLTKRQRPISSIIYADDAPTPKWPEVDFAALEDRVMSFYYGRQQGKTEARKWWATWEEYKRQGKLHHWWNLYATPTIVIDPSIDCGDRMDAFALSTHAMKEGTKMHQNAEDERQIAAANKKVADAFAAYTDCSFMLSSGVYYEAVQRAGNERKKLLADIAERKEKERLAAVEAAKPKLATGRDVKRGYYSKFPNAGAEAWQGAADLANSKARDYYLALALEVLADHGCPPLGQTAGTMRHRFSVSATKSTGNEHA